MRHPFSHTRLLLPPEKALAEQNLYLYYTAQFSLPEEPAQEPLLYFWTSGLAEIAVNGVPIHQGPCRSTMPLLYYDKVPIKGLLAGKNRISVKLQMGLPESNGLDGLLIQLEVGDRIFLNSPEEFHACYLRSYRSDAPTNSGAGFSEIVTAGTWEDSWFAADAPVPGQLAVFGEKVPDYVLYERPIPRFREVERRPSRYVRENGAVLAEFEEIVFGRVEVSGKSIGDVTVGYIEDLELGWSNSDGRQEMYRDQVLTAPGGFHFKSFRKRAMRYIRVYGAEDVKVSVWEYGYPLEDLGTFSCSDDRLNRLMDIGRATLKVNMDDIYNDCPHRDQSQWMDAYLSSRTALALFGDTALARKCLYQHALGACVDGRILSPSIGSTLCDRTHFADYALIFFDYVMWYYRVTGEKQILVDFQENLRSVLEFFRGHVDGTGLIVTTPQLDMVYLDNTFELPKKPHSASLNALFYMAQTRFAELCAVLEQPEEAAMWRDRAAKLQSSFFRVFTHGSLPDCIRDADTPVRDGWYMVNFSCELGRWHSCGAALEFDLFSEGEDLDMEVAAYAGFRLFCNGKLAEEDVREGDWRRQPCYEPVRITLPLKAGWNRIRWEVEANQLNFELFFRTLDGRDLKFAPMPGGTENRARMTEFDYLSAADLAGGFDREIRVRRWVAPQLSQSTQMYACICDIFPEYRQGARALKRTMKEEYIRTYLSVRVPYFCVEAGENREQEPWVMPVNTPWPGSFLLQALGDYGCGSEGLDVLRRFWGGMLDQGAVNTWEEWGNGSSLCHAWGATGCHFLLSRVLGVDHTTAHLGYLVIRPCLYDLAWAEGSVAVGRGGLKIGISLRKEASGTRVDIRVPEGVNVKIDLSLLENPVLAE